MAISMTSSELRKAFEQCLKIHFGVNSNSGFAFSEEGDEFRVEIDGTEDTVTFAVDKLFGIITPAHANERVERRMFYHKYISTVEGEEMMKEAARRHKLELTFENGNIVITCKELFCLDRQFILRRTRVRDSFAIDEGIYEFVVEGMNEYKPFPENVLKDDAGNDQDIHAFILHKYLLRGEHNK